MDDQPRDHGAGTDMWAQMRAEERAEQLAQVVQDTVRDAKLADLLEVRDPSRGR